MYGNRYKERGRRTGTRSFLTTFLITITIVYAVNFIPVPYYIYKPGTAEVLKPMVKVAEGDPEEKGAFMLTTITMGRSSVLGLFTSRWNPNADIRKKEEVLRGSTEEEYSARQQFIMLDSQGNAIQAAYAMAQIPYSIDSTGVLVMQTVKGMPAYGILEPGDRIVRVGDRPIIKHADVVNELKGRKVGETVEVTVKRGKEEKRLSVTLQDLNELERKAKQAAGTGEAASGATNPAGRSAEAGEPRVGLGISTAELLEIVPEAAGKKVTIDAGAIGGPSAGLLFSLEIYNQLTPGDLTKGYRIAGTGTIDAKGNVCSIGGIRQKIVAADREKADIFFAPVDRVKGECNLTADVPNASDAIDQAAKIETPMKVVPVATLADALRYLDGLPAKPSK